MSNISPATNQALKVNRALLGKRKKQKFSYASSKDETNTFTKKATPEQLQKVRDRIQKQKKQEQKKLILITIVALVIVYFFATAIDWHSWFFTNLK
jgi:hypothetical protein